MKKNSTSTNTNDEILDFRKLQKNFFSFRIVNIWNSLPSEVNAPSLNSFKTDILYNWHAELTGTAEVLYRYVLSYP